MARKKITRTERAVLRALFDDGRATTKLLTQKVQQTYQNVRRVVSKLEEMGLIEQVGTEKAARGRPSLVWAITGSGTTALGVPIFKREVVDRIYMAREAQRGARAIEEWRRAFGDDPFNIEGDPFWTYDEGDPGAVARPTTIVHEGVPVSAPVIDTE